MKIYVDADACPVKDTIISIAEAWDISVVLVMSYSHYSPVERSDDVETIYVDKGVDAADFRIMQLVSAGDIIVTQDYGLASLALAKKCYVLHHKGFAYTDRNIDRLLHTRYLSAKARKSGERTKGPKAYTEDDEVKFSELLERTIEWAQND